MNLRATHHGYTYQDLLTGVALVDLMLGSATGIMVDTKGFEGDRFDDLTIDYRSGRRVRIQVKHTTQDRDLAKATFSADGRSLKLNYLFDVLLSDLAAHPCTTYRVVVRDGAPDTDLAAVLKPVDPGQDPGDPLPGISTHRYKFDPDLLRTSASWKNLVEHLTDEQVRAACAALTIDTNAPASTINLVSPGPAELALLRRSTEELGAGRPPNAGRAPEDVALALIYAATAARALNGNVRRENLSPRIGLVTDFGAVTEGHPVERAVAVSRAGTAAGVKASVQDVIPAGGRVILTGEPGIGKSWLCEQLADSYASAGWIVARHHCWLGASDLNRDERVLADVVVGSLLAQLEKLAPESMIGVRPRFAATCETLEAALQACRDTDAQRNILLIVDGLDHVNRVLGRNSGGIPDPSRNLVDRLASINLPVGVVILIASQPGPHLDNANPYGGAPVQLPPMSWDEVELLARRHHAIPSDGTVERTGAEEQGDRNVVDILYDRSNGNALYATYLCRHATRVSPLDHDAPQPTRHDVIRRLQQVPAEATDLSTYYDHLLKGLSDGQKTAIGALAVCDFALTSAELGEMVPEVALFLDSALAALAPVLNSQPGLGGLRIHHESFSRHILRDKPEFWISTVRQKASDWLEARGFLDDARAFRNLPDLLAQLDKYDELKALIGPSFVGDAIRALQPPEALKRVVSIVAQQSEHRLDWPTLTACVELRKAIEVYETESLPDTLINYGDVAVSIVGAEKVAQRLLYDGRATFPARWGLRLCRIVDEAGASAPWDAYLLAQEREEKSDRTTYLGDDEGKLQLAMQLGSLRVREQRDRFSDDFVDRVAEHLDGDHAANLGELVAIFAAGLPTGSMPGVVAKMTDPVKAATAYITLADLAATGEPGLPAPIDLARRAHRLNPTGDISSYLLHGIAPEEVLTGLGATSFEAALRVATSAVTTNHHPDHDADARWITFLRLAHSLDRTMPPRLSGDVAGIGFYRAWLKFTISTVGIADDIASGFVSTQEASTTVRIALEQLAEHAQPFTGSPRACDLYSVHPLIHDVIESSLVVVQQSDLKPVLDRLNEIGNGTSTSLSGMAENGPLTTNDLLGVLARVSESIGIEALHALIGDVRENREGTHSMYSIEADFELAIARICITAGATAEAEECWARAAALLAAYGGHKDPTISEFIDTITDLADVNVQNAREALERLLDLAYLVRQHTDGRGTNHVPQNWWETLARIDPIAAAVDGANVWLAELGFEDARVQTALEELLETQTHMADPIVVAALRMAAGSDWRRPDVDFEILTRLQRDYGQTPQGDAVLTSIANNIAASYDDQPLTYAGETTKSVATDAIIEAVTALGGTAFAVRKDREDEDTRRSTIDHQQDKQINLLKLLESRQRPLLPTGREGAIAAARDYEKMDYQGDANAARWSIDALMNAIGWRILETVQSDGAKAGIELLDDIAQEISPYKENSIFAAIGDGLAARCDDTTIELKTVASYCLVLAYTRIRGGGGWRSFAGRERADLWVAACALDLHTAERALAAAVGRAAQCQLVSLFGVTQGIISSFAAQPTGSTGGTAIECWNAAYNILRERLPGLAARGHHRYEPTTSPDRVGDLNDALATLAVASISQGMRSDLRRALLAVTLLLTCRPIIAQVALVRVLGQPLDAARIAWLLEVVKACLPRGQLIEEMAASLTILSQSDLLSVRVLAAKILMSHNEPVATPPANEPAAKMRRVFSYFRRETQ